MNRCVLAAAPALVAATVALAALPATAQAPRNFPANALRGELLIEQPPAVQLNGQPARLSPGSRIRGENNLLAMSGALVGQRLIVHYTLDDYGLVHDIWVLTAAERARRPWPTRPEQLQSWRFDPVAQTWSTK